MLLIKNPNFSRFFALAFALISVSANAMDEAKRRAECTLLVDPSDIRAFARALRNAVRAGKSPAQTIIRATQTTLDGVAGRVFQAKDHKPPSAPHLQEIRTGLQAEAEWWHNPGARELTAGDQFITRNGEHRWTKVVAGSEEIWRGPDGLLVGDVVNYVLHRDALRIDQALDSFYAQAIQENGRWKWPNRFDPEAFLRQEMSLSDSRGRGDVTQYFDPLIASIAGILEPDIPWRLPVQQGVGNENPGPTREWSILRHQSALEVLSNTFDRRFWSSSALVDHYFFWERYGESTSHSSNYPDFESIRLVARRR